MMKKPMKAVSSMDHRCVMTRRGKVYPRHPSGFATFITAPSWMVVTNFSALRSANRRTHHKSVIVIKFVLSFIVTWNNNNYYYYFMSQHFTICSENILDCYLCVFLLWKALITVIQVFQFSAVKIKYITAEYPEGNTSCLLHHSSFQNPVQKVWLLLPFNINEISSRVQVSLLWWLPHHVWAQLQLSGNTFALKTNVCLLQAALACVGCWTCPYMSSWNINMSK